MKFFIVILLINLSIYSKDLELNVKVKDCIMIAKGDPLTYKLKMFTKRQIFSFTKKYSFRIEINDIKAKTSFFSPEMKDSDSIYTYIKTNKFGDLYTNNKNQYFYKLKNNKSLKLLMKIDNELMLLYQCENPL